MRSNKSKTLCTRLVAAALVALFLLVLTPRTGISASISTTDPGNGDTISGIYDCVLTDAGGASGASLYVDGTLIGYMNSISGTEWGYSLDTRGWSDGTHLLRFQSDGGGTGDDIVTVSVVFDNSAPAISDVIIHYPSGQTAVKVNDTVYVTARISDSVSGIDTVQIDGSPIGDILRNMTDDGMHNDGSADDGVWGSELMTANEADGYYNMIITAADLAGNTATKKITAAVDTFTPTVTSTSTIYPPGQSGAKFGDSIRIIAKVTDTEVMNFIPLDVILAFDKSGSMAEIISGDTENKLYRAKEAGVNFVNSMNMPPDRGCVYYFSDAMGPGVDIIRSQDLTTVKTDVTTAISSIPSPGGNTPLRDTIIDALTYGSSNLMTDHTMALILLTDGNDTSSTATKPQSLTAVSTAFTTYGIRTFMIGFGNSLEMDEDYMIDVANAGGGTSTGGGTGSTQYFYAPDATTLNNIYNEISSVLKTMNETAPFGIQYVTVNATAIGGSATELMYDDGIHGDNLAGDNIYGSNLITDSSKVSSPVIRSLEVTAHDIADNTNKKYASVVLDDTSPVVSGTQVTYPGGNSASDGEYVKIGIAASDGTGVGILSVTVDLSEIGGSPAQATSTGGIGWETPSIAVSTGNSTGVFTVWATIKDKAGNSVMQSIDVRVDNAHLAVAMSAPAPVTGGHQYVSGTFVFRATASDPSAVGQAFLDLFGSRVPMAYNPLTGYFEYTVDTTSTPDGTYSISAAFYDTLGTEVIAGPFEFRVDNSIPAMTITSPINGGYLEGTGFPIGVSVNDTFPDKLQYDVDGNGWVNATVPLNTTAYPDGEHILTLMATDKAGHIVQQALTVFFDNHLPVTVLNAPAPGGAVCGNYLFKVTANDANGISSVVLEFLSTNTTYNFLLDPVSGYWQLLMDTSTYTDGEYNVTVTAGDNMFPVPHQNVVGPFVLTVDNSIPIISFSNPAPGGYLGAGGAIILGLTASDAFIKSFEYSIDGNAWVDSSTPLNTTVLADGPHSLKARAIDAAGHVSEEEITFFVDKFSPICEFATPSPGQFISSFFTFRALAFDQVGIDTVNIDLFDVALNLTVVSGSMALDPATGEYYFLLDTGTLPDGIYNLTYTAVDLSGKPTQAAAQIFIDNNAPDLFVMFPKNNGFVEGTVNFTGNVAYSDLFLSKVTYNIDGLGETDILTPWNTSAFADGPHDLMLSAMDGSGRITVKTLMVYVDNTPPTCDIVSPVLVPLPPLYEVVSGEYTFRVQSQDAIGVKNVSLVIFDMTVPLSYNTVSGSFERTIDTSALPDAEDGNNTAVAFSTDLSGKVTKSQPVIFNLDNNAPIVNVMTPANGAYISTEMEIEIGVKGEPFPYSAMYNLDGNGWQTLNTVAPLTKINGKGQQLSDGPHVMGIRVTDLAKHTTEVTVNFFVQNSPPALTIMAPTSGQFLGGVYTFRASASDPVGVKSVTGLLQSVKGSLKSDQTFTYNTATGYWELELDTTTFQDAEYKLTVNATTQSKSTIATVNFKIDNTVPLLSINKPLDGACVWGTYNMSIYANDTYMAAVEYNIYGTKWETTSTKNGNIQVAWDTRLLPDGQYTAKVRATDLAGHATTQQVTVQVDNTPVSVLMQSPAAGQHLAGIAEVRLSAEDAIGVSMVKLTLERGGTALMTDYLVKNTATQLYSYNFDTTRVKDGAAQLKIAAYDRANHLTAKTTNITIDNSAPVITMVKPVPGTHTGSIEFKVKVTDTYSSVEKVELFIDTGRVWIDMLNSSSAIESDVYTYVWFTTMGDNGDHQFGVRATDTLGNTKTTTGSVSVGNVERTDYLGMILRALPLMVFVFIIMVLLLVLVLLRRGSLQRWVRGERPPEPNAKDGSAEEGSKPREKESEFITSVRKAKVGKKGDEQSKSEDSASDEKASDDTDGNR